MTEASVEENENIVDAFESMEHTRKRSIARRKKKHSLKSIQIRLSSTHTGTLPDDSVKSSTAADSSQETKFHDMRNRRLNENERKQRELELEDTLSFFSETHEDQEPEFEALRKKIEEEKRNKNLQDIEKEDTLGRKEIETIITGILKDKQAKLEMQVANQRSRIKNEGKQRSQRLDQAIHRKSAERRRDIQKGIELYNRRHQEEVNNAIREHQKRVHQQRLGEAAASKEWNAALRKLQAQQSRELADYRAKGEEVMSKLEQEYKREKERNDTIVRRRIEELQRQQQKMQQQLSIRYQQSRQRHLQRHAKLIEKRKLEILERSSPDKKEKASRGEVSIAEQRPELKQAIAVVSKEPWVHELDDCGNASARHKHRRTINSQNTARQLSVEIHNEGVRLSAILDAEEKKKLGGSVSRDTQDFIPWGVKASSVIEAVISGEIPIEAERVLEAHPSSAELTMNQGGQVRCSIFDLRTSETTASSQRAQAIKEYEQDSIRSYETKLAEINKLVSKADNEVKRLEHMKKEQAETVVIEEKKSQEAQKMYDDFKKKYITYFTSDGDIVPDISEKNREDLKKANEKLNANIEEMAKKLELAKASHDEVAARLQKSLLQAKTIQRNSNSTSSVLKKKQAIASMAAGAKMTDKQIEAASTDQATARVDDIIGSLHVVAGKRRRNADQSRNPNFHDKWIESIPEIPKVVKESLFSRMQRRSKHHIILRPTPERLTTSLREAVNNAAAKWPVGKNSTEKSEAIHAAVERAEQLFLLATHPLAVGDEQLSPALDIDTEERWAEPGCLLNLTVPVDSIGLLLPRQPALEIFERNLAEFSSSYGRQCVSCTNIALPTGMGAPLSSLAVASSIAESNPTLSNTRRSDCEGDPLYISEEITQMGYAFRCAKPRPSSPSKKKAAHNKSSVESPDAASKRKASSRPPIEPQQKVIKTSDHSNVSEPTKPSPVRRSPSTPSPRSRSKPLVDANVGHIMPNRSNLSPGFGSVMHQNNIPNNRLGAVGRPPQGHQLAMQRQQSQFQTHPMAHLQLMQQQQQQQQQQSSGVSPRHHVNGGFPQPAIIQQMYGSSLSHTNPMAHMHMQNPSTMHAQQQHHFQQQNQQRQQQFQQLQLQQFQLQQQQQQLQQKARKHQNETETK